jgi:protein transport protein SEC24
MPIMLEAVMRVRATRGIRMSSFHGNFFVRSTDLLAMPAVPQDTSYAIELQIEETISSPFVVFQTAILHTTCYGTSLPYFQCLGWHVTGQQANVESAS